METRDSPRAYLEHWSQPVRTQEIARTLPENRPHQKTASVCAAIAANPVFPRDRLPDTTRALPENRHCSQEDGIVAAICHRR